MNIIFCHPFDQDAIWLYLELRKMGLPIQLLAPEQVLMAREWTQSFDNDGDDFVVTTREGFTIRSHEVDFFFNRLQLVDAPIWRRTANGEREYVRSEMTAMLMSWLYQVQRQCLMINPPVGNNLCGPAWSKSQWAKAAFEAGFEDTASDARPEHDEKVLVVGGKVISGSKNGKLSQRCIRLAQIAQSPLLEISIRDHGSTFMAATALPAFRGHGEKFLALLRHQLTRKAR